MARFFFAMSSLFLSVMVAPLHAAPLTTSAAPTFFERIGLSNHQHWDIATVLTGLVLVVGVLALLLYYLVRLRNSERQIRDHQRLLESVFEQSNHYIGIFDHQGGLISCNHKFQELLYRQGVSLEQPLWQHPHWEDASAERIKAYFEEVSTQPRQFEAEIWHADQGAIVLEWAFKPMFNMPGEPIQYLCEAQDITWRKITEDKLFQREASLSHYYDLQPVMMLTLDEQNRIQQVNRFAEQMLGFDASQMLGHRLKEFYLSEQALSARQMLLQPNQSLQGVWQREIEYRHADGHAIWVRENIRALVETGHLLIVGEDVTPTRKLADELAYQAKFDLLTNTYNRNQFELELAQALQETETELRTHAMLYLDLDQLKVLNDTAGHDAGDGAIQFCASMLEEVLPYNAVLARMGGDEFAILLKDCTERDAIQVAKIIVATLAEHAFWWDDIRLNLTCSIGIRLIDHTATSPQMVHAQADTACHAAKEEGRNRYNLYRQDDADLCRRQLEMESVNLVHDALAKDRVELFAQQILALSGDDAGMHFEILVRIKNAAGEYVSPGIFVPASERYNVAHLLDKQVVEQTLCWFETRPQVLAHLGLCSINLSGHSMGNAEFIDTLLARLQRSDVPCEKICFEITETAAMRNLNQAIDLFSRLKQLGCRIALDDFGSGLSSFGYLKKLPIDIVKIDGLFVRDIDVNETDHLMVRSIHDLARQMGKQTVAEFVENEAILQRLREIGVHFAQGYQIGKPQPIDELVEQLLTAQKA
ncbi:EAL domain-containing protein [Vibrio furnissii]|nr:bifunctional diguanylate cyclase/phosphodiesterase [Vibrio furnissii]WJG21579.1 EAL domain-containing protein [Vibrio furnissii]